jgi:hypothetical protein
VKFKLDEHLDVRLASLITEGGHDVKTVQEQGISGCKDQPLYDECVREQRTLITLDLGFSNPDYSPMVLPLDCGTFGAALKAAASRRTPYGPSGHSDLRHTRCSPQAEADFCPCGCRLPVGGSLRPAERRGS